MEEMEDDDSRALKGWRWKRMTTGLKMEDRKEGGKEGICDPGVRAKSESGNL